MAKLSEKVKDGTVDLKRNILYALQDKKAESIVELNLSKVGTALFDRFIICTATSTTHAEALFDNVLMTVKKNLGIFPKQTEGVGNSQWILVDYFDILVHIFLSESREFYNLESLWKDAERIEYNELIELEQVKKGKKEQ
ncbi:MAG: ribosome silencing factor [Lentimicrobiaceae bacterium]|nr:ribosome silencing factor [Lentimicrobiaceae bacterium]